MSKTPRLKMLRPQLELVRGPLEKPRTRRSDDGTKLWKNDADRGTAAARGYGHAWRQLRELVIERDLGLCQRCPAERPTPGTQVDHIIPRTRGGTDDLTNLRLLCRACHDQKSRDEMRGIFES